MKLNRKLQRTNEYRKYQAAIRAKYGKVEILDGNSYWQIYRLAQSPFDKDKTLWEGENLRDSL